MSHSTMAVVEVGEALRSMGNAFYALFSQLVRHFPMLVAAMCRFPTVVIPLRTMFPRSHHYYMIILRTIFLCYVTITSLHIRSLTYCI